MLAVTALERFRATLRVIRASRGAGIVSRIAIAHRVHAFRRLGAGAGALAALGDGVRAACHATAAGVTGAPFRAHPARFVAPALFRLSDAGALTVAEALAAL